MNALRPGFEHTAIRVNQLVKPNGHRMDAAKGLHLTVVEGIQVGSGTVAFQVRAALSTLRDETVNKHRPWVVDVEPNAQQIASIPDFDKYVSETPDYLVSIGRTLLAHGILLETDGTFLGAPHEDEENVVLTAPVFRAITFETAVPSSVRTEPPLQLVPLVVQRELLS